MEPKIAEKKHYESHMRQIVDSIKSKNAKACGAIAANISEMRSCIDNYKKYPNPDPILLGSCEIIYNMLNKNIF